MRLTVNMPGFAYGCVATTPLPPVESPKSHVYATTLPSGSREADASNVTLAPTTAGFGVAVKDAIGGARTAMCRYAVAVNDSLSVSVRVALNVPKVRYVWATVTPLPPVESPKSQAYETMFPSGSEEPEASNATGEPTITGFGVAVKDATGGWPGSQYR